MRNIFIVIILMLVCSCKNTEQQHVNNSIDTSYRTFKVRITHDKLDSELNIIPIGFKGIYPKVVDSLSLNNLFDQAKWDMYCISYADTCFTSKEYKIQDTIIPFSGLILKYEGHKFRNDTLQIYFGFYYKDIFRCDNYRCSNIFPLHGVCYKLGSKSFYAYVDLSMSEHYIDGLRRKKENGIKYLTTHPPQNNSWLLDEARKRGVIK